MTIQPSDRPEKFLVLATVPGITVDQRMDLEGALRKRMGAHGEVSDGDTDLDEARRIFVYTDTPKPAA